MDWTVVFAAGGFGLALAGAIGALMWLIIRLAVQPVADDVAELKNSLRPMELKLKSEAELARMISAQVWDHKEACRLDREKREEKERDRQRLSAGHVVAAIVVAALLGWLTVGCASYEKWELDRETGKMILVAKGSTAGFFRDLEEDRTYDPTTGRLVRERTATKSTTSDVMSAANELIGTATATAAKVAP
jgi:hypothetical protein